MKVPESSGMVLGVIALQLWLGSRFIHSFQKCCERAETEATLRECQFIMTDTLPVFHTWIVFVGLCGMWSIFLLPKGRWAIGFATLAVCLSFVILEITNM